MPIVKMKLIGKKVSDEFKKKHTELVSQINSWYEEVNLAEWLKPLDIKQRYASASFLPNDYVIFNFKGNKYRLLAQINYQNKIVCIKKIGTHNEYMNWSM
jgi:mRNA interferase HigB